MTLPALIAKPSMPRSLVLLLFSNCKLLFKLIVYLVGNMTFERGLEATRLSRFFKAGGILAYIRSSAGAFTRRIEHYLTLRGSENADQSALRKVLSASRASTLGYFFYLYVISHLMP